MKHNLKVTIIILAMFLLAQFIGLAVQHADIFHLEKEINGTVQEVPNPYLAWIQPPEVETQEQSFSFLGSFVIAFAFAILLLIFLSKFKIQFILKAWFFLVVAMALSLSVYAFEKIFFPEINSYAFLLIPLTLTIPLAFIKIYKNSFLVHNITELFVYPGIAAVFVPILNFLTVIILLILISLYDMWAVWHSGIMQKMAKYQINKLKIFSGFFVPYAGKRTKQKIKLLREKLKQKKITKKELNSKKFRVNVAMLGGGDVIFPIIAAGVMLKTFGLISALFVIAGATLGLTYLFFFSEKKKFYPAMPFITAGIFIGMIASLLFL